MDTSWYNQHWVDIEQLFFFTSTKQVVALVGAGIGTNFMILLQTSKQIRFPLYSWAQNGATTKLAQTTG